MAENNKEYKEYKPLISRLKNKEWTRFTGATFPPYLFDLMQKHAFKSRHGEIFSDTTWYKGSDPDTATEWVFVMDDGAYYKVFAEYAFWRTATDREGNKILALQCVWSLKHLKKTLRNYLETGSILPDPGYQT